MKSGWWRLFGLWLLATASLLAPPSHAIMTIPQPIEGSIPDEFRPAFLQFLRDLSVADAEEVLNATKKGCCVGIDNKVLLFRIEHKSLCIQDRCLTVVATAHDGKLRAHLMFFAGKFTNDSDVYGPFPPFERPMMPPRYFYTTQDATEAQAVILETPAGWIVYSK